MMDFSMQCEISSWVTGTSIGSEVIRFGPVTMNGSGFYMDGDSVERLAKVMKKSETEIRQVLVEHGVSLEH